MPKHMQNDMITFLQLLRSRVAAEEAALSESGVDESQSTATAAHHASTEDYAGLLNETNWTVQDRSVSYINGDNYKGDMLGDQRHGQGTHHTSVGDTYEGHWEYDARSGHGKFTMKDGTCYVGNWEDDKASGTGTCTYPDGSVYEGDWLNDERSGWGKLTMADGQVFEGEWHGNKPHGQGEWMFADGLSYYRGSFAAGNKVEGQLVLFDTQTKKPAVTYTGGFKANMKHGEGVEAHNGLWVYKGAWRKDCRWGQGVCNYLLDGSVYEGKWKNDAWHGQGKLTQSDGYTYEGEWLDGKQHGNGKARYANTERYLGQWQHGTKHGHGKWTGPAEPVAVATGAAPPVAGSESGAGDDGGSSGTTAAKRGAAIGQLRESYVGGWVHDCREGPGVAVFADGGRYQGNWKANKRHGEGLMMFPDGTVFRGMWDQGEWVQSAADPLLCRPRGPGLSCAMAGEKAWFTIQARDELDNPRLNGGDTFRVLLVPSTTQSALATAAMPAAVQLQPELSPAGNNLSCTAAEEAAPLHGMFSASSSAMGKTTAPAALLASATVLVTGCGTAAADTLTAGTAIYAADSLVHKAGACSDNERQPWLATQPCTDQAVGLQDGSPGKLVPVVEAVAVADVQDNGDGTYSCSYSYAQAGTYELHIVNGEGEHVSESPYPIKILAGPPAAAHSTVTGLGRSQATASCSATFTVEVRDAHGNVCGTPGSNVQQDDGPSSNKPRALGADSKQMKVEARLIGSNTLTAAKVAVVPAAEGRSYSCSYTCSYTAPAVAGLYVLEVTASSKHLKGSPFSVKVLPREGEGSSTVQAVSGAPQIPPSTGSSTSNTASTQHYTHTVQDKVKWWGEVAREAFAAVDGSLDGFEAQGHDSAQSGGLDGPEAELVKANPNMPVVERLEDLWLLSRLQQERKIKEQQVKEADSYQQHNIQQQQQQQLLAHYARQLQQSNTANPQQARTGGSVQRRDDKTAATKGQQHYLSEAVESADLPTRGNRVLGTGSEHDTTLQDSLADGSDGNSVDAEVTVLGPAIPAAYNSIRHQAPAAAPNTAACCRSQGQAEAVADSNGVQPSVGPEAQGYCAEVTAALCTKYNDIGRDNVDTNGLLDPTDMPMRSLLYELD